MAWTLVILLAILAFALLWIYQFAHLMLLEEAHFPSKYDKWVWVIAFLLVPLLTPLAFLVWKSARLAERDELRDRGTRSVGEL